MNGSLFLHFGPGGTSRVERTLLSHLKSVDWLDQPTQLNSTHPYFSLLDWVSEKIGPYQRIYAHSFGCDLALAALDRTPNWNGSLILISPIPRLPQSLLQFAKMLLATARHPLIESASLDYFKNPSTPNFFALAGAVASHPNYFELLCPPQSSLKEHTKKAIQEMNLPIWAQVITERLNTPQPKLLISNKIRIHLGAMDPYLDIASELEFWRQNGLESQVTVHKETGHFLHLQNPEKIFTDL